jgi:LysR family glycine cleavage system transcriptional activator
VIHAALSGLGVALGRTPLIDGALADGTLVRPFAQELRSKAQYWLVYEKMAPQRTRIAAFIDWIRAQALLPGPNPPQT